jgi:hypothetical protein
MANLNDMLDPVPELTQDQQLKILQRWNDNSKQPPSLKELVQLAFGQEFDGRSLEAKAVKAFLASKDIRVKASHEYDPKGLLPLTEADELFIINNCDKMSSLEIAKELFKKDNLGPLSQECRTVAAKIKTIDKKVIVPYEDPDDIPTTQYKPPKILSKAVARINRYIHESIDEKKLTGKQKKDIQSLIGYLHTYRFLAQMNTMESVEERELFESSFIRYTYDKGDLTSEEVDQYIILSHEVVNSANILRHIKTLQGLLDGAADEDKKLAVSYVDAIDSARKEYSDCVKRQQQLLKDLVGKRSDRLSAQKEGATILNLIEAWKNEEDRQAIIKIAEKRKAGVEREIERLSSMDDLKCLILGISPDEILNG